MLLTMKNKNQKTDPLTLGHLLIKKGWCRQQTVQSGDYLLNSEKMEIIDNIKKRIYSVHVYPCHVDFAIFYWFSSNLIQTFLSAIS